MQNEKVISDLSDKIREYAAGRAKEVARDAVAGSAPPEEIRRWPPSWSQNRAWMFRILRYGVG